MAFKIAVGDMEMEPRKFWRLTPAEFHEKVAGRNRQIKAEHVEKLNLSVHTAFFVAKFMREKKAISLNNFLYEEKDLGEKQSGKQTPEQMAAILRIRVAASGGEVKSNGG